jgi:hypothetical protein
MTDEKRTVDQSEMPPSLPDVQADQMTVEQWLAIRKEAGLKIDPETAEVTWEYANTLDPYGVYPDLPGEYQVGREYFARSPASEVWVNFHDLPAATRDALWEKHRSNLAFPAGLEGLLEVLQEPSDAKRE